MTRGLWVPSVDLSGIDWRFVFASLLIGGLSLTLAWYGLQHDDIVTSLGALLLLPSSVFLILLGVSDPTANLRTGGGAS